MFPVIHISMFVNSSGQPCGDLSSYSRLHNSAQHCLLNVRYASLIAINHHHQKVVSKVGTQHEKTTNASVSDTFLFALVCDAISSTLFDETNFFDNQNQNMQFG